MLLQSRIAVLNDATVSHNEVCGSEAVLVGSLFQEGFFSLSVFLVTLMRAGLSYEDMAALCTQRRACHLAHSAQTLLHSASWITLS